VPLREGREAGDRDPAAAAQEGPEPGDVLPPRGREPAAGAAAERHAAVAAALDRLAEIGRDARLHRPPHRPRDLQLRPPAGAGRERAPRARALPARLELELELVRRTLTRRAIAQPGTG